jgi:hypothetical protein
LTINQQERSAVSISLPYLANGPMSLLIETLENINSIDTLENINASSIAASFNLIHSKPSIVSFNALGNDTKKLVNNIAHNVNLDEDNITTVKVK